MASQSIYLLRVLIHIKQAVVTPEVTSWYFRRFMDRTKYTQPYQQIWLYSTFVT